MIRSIWTKWRLGCFQGRQIRIRCKIELALFLGALGPICEQYFDISGQWLLVQACRRHHSVFASNFTEGWAIFVKI